MCFQFQVIHVTIPKFWFNSGANHYGYMYLLQVAVNNSIHFAQIGEAGE